MYDAGPLHKDRKGPKRHGPCHSAPCDGSHRSAGGGVRGSQVAVSVDIAKEKLDNMIEAGVDCILNVCSFCHLQYEASQVQLNKELGEKKYQIPVIYYTQLLGLAMGLEPSELGLGVHMIDTQPLLDKIQS